MTILLSYNTHQDGADKIIVDASESELYCTELA